MNSSVLQCHQIALNELTCFMWFGIQVLLLVSSIALIAWLKWLLYFSASISPGFPLMNWLVFWDLVHKCSCWWVELLWLFELSDWFTSWWVELLWLVELSDDFTSVLWLSECTSFVQISYGWWLVKFAMPATATSFIEMQQFTTCGDLSSYIFQLQARMMSLNRTALESTNLVLIAAFDINELFLACEITSTVPGTWLYEHFDISHLKYLSFMLH